jgi:hypothetical protein
MVLSQRSTKEQKMTTQHTLQAQVTDTNHHARGMMTIRVEFAEGAPFKPHTVRGAIAGTLKKKLGLAIVAEKIEGPDGTPGVGQRRYRIAAEARA